MEKSLKTLLDCISNFELYCASNAARVELTSYCKKIDEILHLVKPVFDDVGLQTSPDEELNNTLQELDALIDGARELIASCNQMTSKIYFVLQIESMITKIQTCSLEICRVVSCLVPLKTNSCASSCIEKLQEVHYEQISGVIKDAASDLPVKKTLKSEILEKISNHLSLSTNLELLMEVVALDKLKAKTSSNEIHLEMNHFDTITALVNYMHDIYMKEKQSHSTNGGVPIPPDFCCPLSLELMSDPVIVASGQTYERAFIKKWLELGCNVCPKTCQTLGHTNLIPNYTVKALIANWCELNDIQLPDPMKSLNMNSPSAFLCTSNSAAKDTRLPHSRSPESMHVMKHANEISHSSNGGHQDSYKHETSMSDKIVGAPSSQALKGCGAEFSGLSLSSSQTKKESSLEERAAGSGVRISKQLKEDSGQASGLDEHFQGHSGGFYAAGGTSGNDHIQESGEDTAASQVSSDSDVSGEVVQEAAVPTVIQMEHEFPPRFGEARPRSQSIWRCPSDRLVPRIISSPSGDSRPDLSGVETQVRKLIEDLKCDSVDLQRAATAELRLLARHNMENRIVIANCGAISLLIGLLYSPNPKTQENAVTALLNLSINDNNKIAIANADVVDPLVHVLETGSPEAKENSAATLFMLSVIEENKVRIGRSRAIKPLVELLANGTPRGKKDAATALFYLSLYHENKARIVQAGAVKPLVELMDPAAGMVDKAVAVLANLSTIPDGRTEIGRAGGISVLVEVVELGSARGKENAAAALLHLCTNSSRFCSMVLQEGAVPPLVVLSLSGTPRAREKAQALLNYFRNQRHGNAGRR